MAHILLVDDEKVARALYGDFLTGAGHLVTALGTSAEAKEALLRQKFDLCVTDLILPQSDGMDLLQFIKMEHPGVEVIMITALDKVDPAVRAIKYGASDYLVKPINPEVLAHAVTRALTNRSVLTENVELRRHVALLETAQRLATTLDREKLLNVACVAFAQACEAPAVLLVLKKDEGWRVEANHGLADEELSQSLAVKVEAVLHEGFEIRGQELAIELPEPYETAYLVPAVNGDDALGAVVLLFTRATPELSLSSAGTLARHLGLALRNLGKFAEVEDLVYLDDLTHLFNSRYLELVLEKEFKNKPPPEGKAFSLLFLDLDYFKSVNDTHGHVIGSKLLVEVSRILKGCVRDGDVLCRWGGDEYVALLRGTDSGGALKVAERIRRSIENHKFLAREGFGLQITTCIGVASWPEHAQDKATLLDFADRAMYRGKKGTRNIIYTAAKGLEATPAARHHTAAPTTPLPVDEKTQP
jgi:two-component system, cell cycle response regulator